MSTIFTRLKTFFAGLFGGSRRESAELTSPRAPKWEPRPDSVDIPKPAPKLTFDMFHFSDAVMEGVRDLGYTSPTPIQEKAIPQVLSGRDIIGLAQTGTGKTAAFVLPMLEKLQHDETPGIRGLILTPTRELAQQIEEQVTGLGYHTRLRCVTIVGGVDYDPQETALKAGVPIIIATPGRLIDHMKKGLVNYSGLKFLVIDEADRLHDMGFLPDLQRIVGALPTDRQSMLFSATMPAPIQHLVAKTLRDPVRIEAGTVNRAATSVEQIALYVDSRNKSALLMKMLRDDDFKSVIIFTNTQKTTQMLSNFLERKGLSVQCIHGGREQDERTETLNRFRSGAIRFLVATDVAARGLDVVGVTHVINYDIPHSTDEYIHRIGRTGRSSFLGIAFTFVTGEEADYWKKFVSRLKTNVRDQTTSFYSGQLEGHRGGDDDGRGSRSGRGGPKGDGPQGRGGRPHRPFKRAKN